MPLSVWVNCKAAFAFTVAGAVPLPITTFPVKVGELENTTLPVPFSFVKAVAKFSDVNEPKPFSYKHLTVKNKTKGEG